MNCKIEYGNVFIHSCAIFKRIKLELPATSHLRDFSQIFKTTSEISQINCFFFAIVIFIVDDRSLFTMVKDGDPVSIRDVENDGAADEGTSQEFTRGK